jgi:iron complex transport system substrate-binding protein
LPLKRIVCLSTTHLSFLSSLGVLDRVVGVSGGKYISNEFILSRIGKGEVVDLGYEQSLNYELLLSIKPDIVFAYGVGSESLGYLNRIRELGVKVVIIGEYLESTPLAKAEWIKVFGAMLGKPAEADSIFSRIESEYIAVSSRFRSSPKKPKVFINLPWNDVWYFPGNENYMATLISDAGGDYLLSNLKGNETHAFSFESAIEKGVNADVWINLGSYNSVEQVLGDFPRLKVLPVMKSGNIFNNNKRISPEGGNDIFESGVMNPHIILKDLVKIFYPDSLEHSLVYYKKL